MAQLASEPPSPYYFRFRLYHRLLHGLLMGSFLGLAATGMPLRFNHEAWAIRFTHAVGGFGAIRFFHLTFAVLLTLCFLLHLAFVFRLAFLEGETGVFWGPFSMVPQPKDFQSLVQHFRWFLGMGPKPSGVLPTGKSSTIGPSFGGWPLLARPAT